MKNLWSILCAIVIIISLNSCKSDTAKTSDINDFREYISGYPQDKISTTSDFKFFLKQPVDASTASNDLLTIKPKVEGKVSIINNVLFFTPTEKLKSNQDYKISLHLSKLYPEIDKKLKNFNIDVKTKELLFYVTLGTPKVYDKEWNYIEGHLEASDLFETDKLPKMLSATYNGKSMPITFDESIKLSSYVLFKIDSLKRYDEDKELKIEWKGDPKKYVSEDIKRLVAGKDNFKVVDIEVIQNDKQQIDVSFSDILQPQQNLKGLIRFDGDDAKKFTYKISQNVLSIFPHQSFKNNAELELFSGIKNNEGFALKSNLFRTLYFEQPKPNISFIKSGTILPNAKNLKLNFNAINLRAVDVLVYKIYPSNVLQFLQNSDLATLNNIQYVGRPISRYTVNLTKPGLELDQNNAYAVDLAEFVPIEPGTMYRVALSFNKDYSNYACGNKLPENTIVYGKKPIDDSHYDSDDYYYYDGDYYWDEREDPCKESYYYDKTLSTNILATNLGVTVKKGMNQTTFIAVTDILTAKPVAKAKVELFNLQQQPIISTTTNAQGIAEFNNNANAFFAVVSLNDNITYVKLNDGSALSMSKFDVSGERLQEGIQGYIYGERGVWRPGDTMYLSFVLNDKANPLPDNHPIKFELMDPNGKLIDQYITKKEKSNVYTYKPSTQSNAITGQWRLKVSVGSAVFYKSLRVETIKPNRLKIKIKTQDKVVISNQNIKGDVEVHWLHGAIAKNLKLDINAKLYKTKTAFDAFKNYNFDDITRTYYSEEFKVLEGQLNDNGLTSYSLKPTISDHAPGMLKASFITKVYENGGDFSTDVFSQDISPYTSYAGINPAEEKDSKNYLYTNEDYTFNVASVNENGQGIANKLEVKIYKLSWRWWWHGSQDGLYAYDGTEFHEPYSTSVVQTNASGKGNFNIKIQDNDWGRYLIKVIDKKSGHSTAQVTYFDWPSWYSKSRGNQDKTNASMLVFTTDKESYQVNEKATVKFPSSKGSRALITIENGTEVLDYYWVETKDQLTNFKFPIRDTYAPNVFVNISLIQPHGQTVNDLPIRMYGSVPMTVTDPDTQLEPQLTIADEVRPESTVTVKVKEKNGKPMTYTVAIVDEGLLDLTRFKTPNPWQKFYAKQSLGVKTWDIFDDVIGAYGGKIDQVLSIGGDESMLANSTKKANRFKPMVTFLGPFDLNARGTGKHKIDIPKYVGSVRAMVIASDVSNKAYGSAEKSVFVRKPVMLLASLPRKITPQETVTLPVSVFAMTPEIKQVNVSLKPNKAFTVLGSQTQKVNFAQPDEKMIYYQLKINDFEGIGSIELEASSGSEKASYSVEIDVFNPNPITTETKELVLKNQETQSLDFSTFGTKGTNEAILEFSSLPPMNFTKRLEYLIQYPHGCLEQTTSSVFPQLFYSELYDLSNDKKTAIQRNIKAGILKIYDFQKPNGGLSYWQGNSSIDSWSTSYAGHFMIEAEKRGYALPIRFKDQWKTYQKQAARQWRFEATNYSDNAMSQAYRLYTLSLANSPDLASMNRLRETSGISNDAKMRLAAAYAVIGKKSVAQDILKSLSAVNTTNYRYSNYGSQLRDEALALETYVLLNQENKAIKSAKDIATELSSNQWMSTQTTAYALLAMSQYALQNDNTSGIDASYSFNQASSSVKSRKSMLAVDISDLQSNNSVSISNKGKGVLYVRLLNKGVLPVGQEKVIQSNLIANVLYKTKEGSDIKVNNLSQGTNFVAEISIQNTTNKRVDNLALTQYIPSGWEIINTRFTEFGENTESSPVDYTDIRDDRLNYYFTLDKNETKTFRVLLNASYLGSYYLPGLQCTAMYDQDYMVRTNGEWIEVKK